jgi:hypothetical protein
MKITLLTYGTRGDMQPFVALPDVPPGPLSYFTHWLTGQLYRYGIQFGLNRLRHADPDGFNLKVIWPTCPLRD